MAGAYKHAPIPGGSGQYPDNEGVGIANAQYSARVFNGAASIYGGWRQGTLTSTGSLTQTFTVSAGERVRIAITWNSHTSGSTYDKIDTLTADLDLIVNYPGGTKTSGSFDNNYEVVAFTAPSGGTVTISVSKPRFERSTEPWGLAWLHYAP